MIKYSSLLGLQTQQTLEGKGQNLTNPYNRNLFFIALSTNNAFFGSSVPCKQTLWGPLQGRERGTMNSAMF